LFRGELQSDAQSKSQDATPSEEKKGDEDRAVYVLTHRLLAGHRVLVCHTQGTSMWAFSHSSVGRRLHQSIADVHRSPPGTGQTAASSLAVEPESRRSAMKPTQAITRQFSSYAKRLSSLQSWAGSRTGFLDRKRTKINSKDLPDR